MGGEVGNWFHGDSSVAGKVEHLPRSYILAVIVCVLAAFTGVSIGPSPVFREQHFTLPWAP